MIIIGLGSNLPGPWGSAAQALIRALAELENRDVTVCRRSHLYVTEPLGRIAQPCFVNAAALLQTPMPPDSLLSLLKKLERQAGRRPGRRWGPRALDLDILDYKGIVRHWTRGKDGSRPQDGRKLILPHAGLHERPFVLKPVKDIAPFWHHPALGFSIGQLLCRTAHGLKGQVVKMIKE